MQKTFRDFIRLAKHTYGLGSLGKAGQIVCDKLHQHGLSPLDVVCYINWADGDCLTTYEIAKHLQVSQQMVDKRLQHIRKIWPHLFYFGPKVPRFNSRRSDRTGTMGRLRHNPSDEVKSF